MLGCDPDALTRPIYVGFTTSQLLGRVPMADSTGRKFLVVGGPSGLGGREMTVPAKVRPVTSDHLYQPNSELMKYYINYLYIKYGSRDGNIR